MKKFRTDLVRKWFNGRRPVEYKGKLIVYNNSLIIGAFTTESSDVIYRKTYAIGYKNQIMQLRLTKDGEIYYNTSPAIYTLTSTTPKPPPCLLVSSHIVNSTWKIAETDAIKSGETNMIPNEGTAEFKMKEVTEVRLSSETKRIKNALSENSKMLMEFWNVDEDIYNIMVKGID